MSKSTSLENNYNTSTGAKYIIKKEISPSKLQSHGAASKVCNHCYQERSVEDFAWRAHKHKLQNQCNHCRRLKDQAYKTSNVFRYITYLAKRIKGRYGSTLRKECSLRLEDFVTIFIQQRKEFGMKCPYSGLTMTYGLGEGKVPTNISIDRFDSSKPYEWGNIIFCCNVINVMKFDSAYHRFVELCEQIAAHKDETPKLVRYLRKQKG